MKISTKGRYALRIMMDLANNENDEFISLKDISKRINISGYVQTARGNNGGYKLAKKPEEYKVGDILRATEGDLAPIYCVSTDGTCDKKDNCSTYFFWEGLDKAINDYVDSKTLADLVK